MFNRGILFYVPLLLILVALSLRLYDLNNAFGYYGDSGRDLLDIYKWFKTGNIPLLGPPASVGNFHLGPFYYYLLAPFLLIFRLQPVGAVYFNLFCGILLVMISFYLTKKFVDIPTAIIFSVLLTFSPIAILLSRGSWNPHPVPLVTILLIFSVINFIRSNKFIYIFISGVLLGIGVQLHYTFLANALPLVLILVFLKTRAVINLKTWPLLFLGFVLPLLPFFIGQIQNNFADFINLQNYLSNSENSHNTIFLKTVIDRIHFPFYVFFQTENLPWYFSMLSMPLWVIILLGNILISFSKTKLANFAAIILIFFFVGSIQELFLRVSFLNHYYLNLGIMTVLLVSIFISYLYQYARVKFLWIVPISLFLWWEIYLIPPVLGTIRNPQIVLKTAQFIINDIKLSKFDPEIGIFVISAINLPVGQEYRYLFEKEGINTFSSTRAESADYLIVEKEDSKNIDYQSKEKERKAEKIKDLRFDTNIGIIKFVEVYKVKRI